MTVVLLALLVGGAVHAQDEEEEGRALFRRGVEAADARDWEAAEEAFRGAYELLRDPAILLNLAGAQVRAGHLVGGVHDYRHFLAGCGGEDARLCTAAEQALTEALRRTPRLRIALSGVEPDDRLLLDDRPLDPAVVGETLLVDPGAHELAVERGGRRAGSYPFTVDEGETHVLSAGVLVADRTGPVTGSDERDGVVRSPWLWTGVGAAVLLGVVLAVVLTRDDGAVRGNFPPGRVRTP